MSFALLSGIMTTAMVSVPFRPLWSTDQYMVVPGMVAMVWYSAPAAPALISAYCFPFVGVSCL